MIEVLDLSIVVNCEATGGEDRARSIRKDAPCRCLIA